MALVQQDFAEKGVSIHVSPAQEGIVALTDHRAFHQVMLNLMTNACQAMPDGGLLHISLRAVSKNDLPERFATCLDLFFFFGQSYAEISETTGHPINTVRSHIRRAKEMLRATLSPDLVEECYGLS